ncbi:Cytochrome P450 [Macleaya cordata]|uniref:Cytochrome P450 n=1 Tax=Macleaya cordata TaxID=56857 RepID=A0A200PPL5_MACCD|nr:Cytochrome P450 [Macleaya cordata]
MIEKISAKIVSVVKEGWSWWWEDYGSNISTSEDQKVAAGLVVSAVLLAMLVTSWYIFRTRSKSRNSKRKLFPLPPGPRGLPLVGNLLSLEPDLHIYLAKLAQVYGPILKLQLGSKVCVVFSSSSLAKEVLRDHDAIFANRDSSIAALVSSYGGHDMAWSPSNSEWRKLPKVFAHDMLSYKNLDSCYSLRREEVRQTVRDLYHNKINTPINAGEQVFIMVLNVIMGMLWGGTLQGEERSRVGAEFRHVISELIELIGKTNVSDLFPALRWFDIQGIERQTKTIFIWLDWIFNSVRIFCSFFWSS